MKYLLEKPNKKSLPENRKNVLIVLTVIYLSLYLCNKFKLTAEIMKEYLVDLITEKGKSLEDEISIEGHFGRRDHVSRFRAFHCNTGFLWRGSGKTEDKRLILITEQ